MPATPLPPIVEDLIPASQIRSLEGGLATAERIRPDDPLLPAGLAILFAMKYEQQCRQDAYAAMLDADSGEVAVPIEAKNVRRKDFTGTR